MIENYLEGEKKKTITDNMGFWGREESGEGERTNKKAHNLAPWFI